MMRTQGVSGRIFIGHGAVLPDLCARPSSSNIHNKEERHASVARRDVTIRVPRNLQHPEPREQGQEKMYNPTAVTERVRSRGMLFPSIPTALETMDFADPGTRRTPHRRQCPPPPTRRLLLLYRHQEIGPPIVEHHSERIPCTTNPELSRPNPDAPCSM